MNFKIESKSWNPSLESEILNKWDIDKIYTFSIHTEKPTFVIDTPPPYPSGRPWHIGAAAHYAQIDMIARTARMKGFNVLFPIGIDRNGLPVEIYTEKKHKIKMRQMDRNKFLELCKVSLDDLESEMLNIMKTLGLSGNFKEYYRTDSDDFRILTQNTFIKLWNKGLIYLSNRPNNYCIDCGTTIADAEIIHENLPTKLIYIKFNLHETNETIVIATTRPELLFACQCIIFNPEDSRYQHLINKQAILPIFGRKIKILSHHSAKPEFGSGMVMVCSYGDHNDVQIFRELGLTEIISIDIYGKMTSEAGQYSNLKVLEARERIILDLKDNNYIEKEENILHRTPICERSKTQVEIIPMKDYYLKQIDFIPLIQDNIKQLKFYPDYHKQILLNWLDSISIDWPISRRRYYGTEIPVWFCSNCEEIHIPSEGQQYYQPWKDDPPFDKCKKCSSSKFYGEEKTFDTWMDSSITPLYISKFQIDADFFSHTYPNMIRPQSKDIVRTWLFYSILRCIQLTENLPWSEAWIMGYGVDEKGTKMSKSKGNVIDPIPILKKYGSDTFRFWSASESSLGQDFRCSEQRIMISQKFLSKIWNLGRFLSSFEIITDISYDNNDNNTILSNLHNSDKWILSELHSLIEECNNGYNSYNFFIPSNAIRDFTWNLFASHYLEMIKARVYNENNELGKKSGLYTLHKCFSTILQLLSPICPFITEVLWMSLYSSESIHKQVFPKFSTPDQEFKKYTESIIKYNSYIWNRKKDSFSSSKGKPLSLKDPIYETIPDDLKLFHDDLIRMHNIIES